jgi:hypothetical protein
VSDRGQMAESLATPDVVAQQIRFALFRLRSRNAHHLFEEVCRHFATARISRNIIPATGPVAAGGDQGRDFETFRSFINEHLSNAFITIEHNRPVVFACTLQVDDLATKIKDDIALIAEGAPTEAVYAFCEADVVVSRRHKLITWAKREHGIALEIIDGNALAEQLAQADVFWIAERFLAVPSDLRPTLTTIARPELAQILIRRPPITLPTWLLGWGEAEFNAYVQQTDPRFLRLDGALIHLPSEQGAFEPCDLLGPNDELIHVRRALSTPSFEHLFNQAWVSTETLLDSTAARNALANYVRMRGEGRVLSPDFRPKEVVLAFPSQEGPNVPLKAIPTFARLALSRVAELFEARDVTVRVVGIRERPGT